MRRKTEGEEEEEEKEEEEEEEDDEEEKEEDEEKNENAISARSYFARDCKSNAGTKDPTC